ncbi:hypothetical protein [Aegicerativicinus sediminis]|uniref:hypothetical protein n=1 Tax=Aegicerativicinus sediminis TaxID=2893202 RepID=UPI001E5284A3|nr:hypothetical protein [Aegicerativicinus sediminis]
MIGDKLTYYSEYKPISAHILSKLRMEQIPSPRFCIAVCGESGCGKSSMAQSLLIDIEDQTKFKGYIFHSDDYFFLPPRTNHEQRLKDINKVGPNEVDLALLDFHLTSFKNGAPKLEKPLVNYSENSIKTELIRPTNLDFCIVEGTYVGNLKSPNYVIFMGANFKQTMANRKKRARDVLDDFNERVLLIEHQIIKKQAALADIIVDTNYHFSVNKKDETS